MTDDPVESDVPTKRMLAWARNSTVYRLGRQMLSEKQLSDAIRRKAKQKFEDINEAQILILARTAVEFAYELGGLDDVAYADASARSGMRSGKSKRIIAQNLSMKGIAPETAAVALEETRDLFAAVVFARKRGFGPFRRGQLDDKRKLKELSAFARRGFGYDIGKRVFEMEDAEAHDILSSAP